ncbi:MAG: hypothetical protein AAF441_22570 [Pseudomonadota bacterium]
MASEIEEAALVIWNDVLSSMPKDLQEGRALVEARRRLIGMPDREALGDVIDALAVQTFGPGQMGDAPSHPDQSTAPQTPTESEIRDWVMAAVADGFAATTDGSAERAEILKQRALGNAERVIDSHKRALGWLARRRLRKLANETAKTEMKSLVM